MLENNDILLIQQMIQNSIREELEMIQKSAIDNNDMKKRIHSYCKAVENSSQYQRKAKVLFTNAGGSASKGSQTTRITLPITWVREMGITPEDREVDIFFEDGKIIIQKSVNAE